MVRQGYFEIELINAETKIPFQEHTHTDGRTYAEVEPDIDYFLHVRSHQYNKVVFRFSVDGKDLDYVQSSGKSNGWRERGLWKRHDGIQSFKALWFNKLYNRNNQVGDGQYEGHWTGSVELKVFEYVEKKNEYSSASRR